MAQHGETSVELAMNPVPNHDTHMTIRADLSSPTHTGQYINCVASDEMKITESGEVNGSRHETDKQKSWQTQQHTPGENIAPRENTPTPGENITTTSPIPPPSTPSTSPIPPSSTPSTSTPTLNFTTTNISTDTFPTNTPTTNVTSVNSLTTNTPTNTSPPNIPTNSSSPTNIPTNNTQNTTKIEAPREITNIKEIPQPTPNIPTLTSNKRRGSKGVAAMTMTDIRKSIDIEPVLAEAMEQVKVGVGGEGERERGGGGVGEAASNLSSILLHSSNHHPPSPPHESLAHGSTSSIGGGGHKSSLSIGGGGNRHSANMGNEKRRSQKMKALEEEIKEIERVEEGGASEVVLEMKEMAGGADSYHDIEAYEHEEVVGEREAMVEGGEKGGVGVGLGEPRTDSMVRKEIVRISVVAVIAVLVVLLFVLT